MAVALLSIASVGIIHELSPTKTDSEQTSSLNENQSYQNSIDINANHSNNFRKNELVLASYSEDIDHAIETQFEKNFNANVEFEVERERIIHTIKRGDSLGSIMHRYDFPASLPHKIVNSTDGENFKNIRIGRQIEFLLDAESLELLEIHYPYSSLERLVAKIDEDVTVQIEEIDHEITQTTASGNITHSLFGAASEAGISDNMIMSLAEIFAWDIDFVRDIQSGDSFKLIYEQHMNGSQLLKEGDIVAAEFTNNDHKFVAIRHIDKNGDKGYYAPDGSSMRGTFLKSPMKFSRISSGFSNRRFHPILKTWRAHKGVDYAARTGTPIRSVADGKVTYRGTKGGYGRTVVLSHGGKYSTLYAHMSKYNAKVKTGNYVKQGQIIGYVGSSGLATGPHLHYEFRVNGVHQNPLTYKTPKAESLDESELPAFQATVQEQLIALNNIENNIDNDVENDEDQKLLALNSEE